MFENATEFSLHIETIVSEKRITHMDAVLLYCEQNLLDPKDVSSMISRSLKEKIRINATDLNYFPKQGALDV